MSIDTSIQGKRIALVRRAGAEAWRDGLPVFTDPAFTLRELQVEDAPSLLAHLATDDVSRFISPPPSSIVGFERFIQVTHRDREAGHALCFAIAPAGTSRAVGLFQLRSLEVGFANGPGGLKEGERATLSMEETIQPDFIQQSLVPLPSETHGGEDLGIYAIGPWSHLFQGTVEENYTFHVMDFASGISERLAARTH